MNDWYKQKLEETLIKAKAAAELGDYDEFQHWNKEADNYRKMIK